MAKKKQKRSIFTRALHGELIPVETLRRYSTILILVFVFLMGYIMNRFQYQLELQKIKKLKSELERVKTDYVSSSASYYSRIREVEMKELADSFGLDLKSPNLPPYRIEGD